MSHEDAMRALRAELELLAPDERGSVEDILTAYIDLTTRHLRELRKRKKQ